ncbi:sigma factor-like helix-turn-helix DNA-binding protein [Caproicibacterium amylolyticum]|uniref:RNA polymerase sigma-70 region 4 domain-containing protein n=1 Tax=Caproicibacterium amylolyticum TaxID=2766537 RepID=A0A7G9WF81_9FIRM|nr:sigma factor-like helix-turn-helix DNA-binding protein [Caproicibacterium amylolyticum]QNO17343.1 hypothetical protein H6X83_10365 [Caproicibacterium amylolyticum]
MTVEEVKHLLRIYYDIPQMIAEEFATIRNCRQEESKIELPAVNMTGMPSGKGMTSDRTANQALSSQWQYYENEVKECGKRIAQLQEQQNWLGTALNRMDPIDRQILQLAFMGDKHHRRKAYRRPPWKEVADVVGYSESQTRERARNAVTKLKLLSNQNVLAGMA